MRSTGALLFSLTLSGAAIADARADTLAADALICESEAAITMALKPHLVDHPGSVIMTRMRAAKEFHVTMARAQGELANLASEEEAIRNAYRVRGSSDVQGSTAAAEKQSSLSQAAVADEFLRQCTATAGPGLAEVVERRPISGVSKVRMIVAGAPADVWTLSRYLSASAQ